MDRINRNEWTESSGMGGQGSPEYAVVPLKDAIAGDTEDTAYFKRAGYFEIPGSWKFNFRPYKDNHNFKKTFILTGSYSHAICHDIKNPGCNIGSLSVEELNVFLARSGRYRDAQKLKPYLFISRLEAKYPWAYSETVLVSRAMGNILKDNTLPYDVLGLFGIVVLFIALGIRSFYLWLYYLYWVASYWFARIGYHDPILGFTSEGWHVIFWSFWHGFIVKEGRIFLVIAIELSVIIFGIFGALNISRQMLSFLIGGLKKCGCRNYRIWSSSRLL